jgi:hypothetical protein
MPALAVGEENSAVGGPSITTSSVVYGMKILAQNVQGIIVPAMATNSRMHWGYHNQMIQIIYRYLNVFSMSGISSIPELLQVVISPATNPGRI